VLPARRGGWRVESPRGTQAVCETPREAEAVAERLVHEAGGGEILVYDAYLRLRLSKRLGITVSRACVL
jgi:hypothetical protein